MIRILYRDEHGDILTNLTDIMTFFMPLAFITGFFGMNFFRPTASLHTWIGIIAFVIVLALMLLIPLFMIWWARRRAWILSSRAYLYLKRGMLSLPPDQICGRC